MTDRIDAKDAVKAAGWFARNLPTLWRWIQWARDATPALLLVFGYALATTACLGTFTRIIANLPDIPQPPAVRTPTPRPEPTPGETSPGPITPTPTPTAVNTATPSPAPTATATVPPSSSACPCQVICTVAFLGWNDKPGLPPDVVVDGSARLDITCRQARSQGDTRGLPVDRGTWPLWCEPASDPVDFRVTVPDGVGQHVFNDGYGLRLSSLKAGSYRIHVTPRKGAVDRHGQPIVLCGWGHDASVRDTLEWSLH